MRGLGYRRGCHYNNTRLDPFRSPRSALNALKHEGYVQVRAMLGVALGDLPALRAEPRHDLAVRQQQHLRDAQLDAALPAAHLAGGTEAVMRGCSERCTYSFLVMFWFWAPLGLLNDMYSRAFATNPTTLR